MGVSLSIIALNRGSKISWKALRDDLAQSWPRLPAAQQVQKKENTLSFDIGSMSVAMGMMPAPIPRDSWVLPERQTWIWPDAATALETHRSHLILTVFGDETALAEARLLTMVTTSVLATCGNPCGVSWGGAGLLIAPDVFKEVAREALPDDLPLHLWLAVYMAGNEDGTFSGFTRGMDDFGLMEFVTENATDPPQELCQRFYGLGDYLLINGPVITDGDTIGESMSERIRVLFCDSPFGHENQVMRLDYAAKKGRSWFGLRS